MALSTRIDNLIENVVNTSGPETKPPVADVITADALPQDTTVGRLFINNEFVQPANGRYIPVINPATEEISAHVAQGDEVDVNAAVQSSIAAFAEWKKTSGRERAVFLRRMGELVKERKPELSRMETMDCGKPYPESEWDIDDVVGCFDYYADLAEKLDDKQWEKVNVGDEEFGASLRYEPMGVCAGIIPWNYPLLMALWKIAPCLAAGCTMVLKPSELTPMTALELGKIAQEAGLPPGVLNIITGTGPSAGAPLVAHPQVSKVAFTGSVPTGSRIMTECARAIRNVSLELGGKSPAIVFESSNIERAVEWVMFGCFWTNGQICSATSRLLIHNSIADEFLDKLVQETNKIRIGDPMGEKIRLGPLVSKGQRDKVLRFIQNASDQGATIACGGVERPDGLPVGYYVRPTVITNVERSMEIWNEEVFGPVLSVMRFETEEEAIELANGSAFGLGSAIFSTDTEQLDRVAVALDAGIVWRNCSQPCFVQMPWGGFKKSGVGRELGPFGLNAYLEPKQICDYVADKTFGWYYDVQ